MEHNEAVEIIAAYTANFAAAEPGATVNEVNAAVAAAFIKYAAAEVDPGTFPYFPHPYNAAETILHHAAGHLVSEVA
jgi:hypothetical protein